MQGTHLLLFDWKKKFKRKRDVSENGKCHIIETDKIEKSEKGGEKKIGGIQN